MNAAAERNGVQLLCGHTHSFDPPIRKMREIVRSGELGRLTMIHTWNYTDLMYRPRMPHELDPSRGGGAVFIQAPHQVDVVRLIGGGMVRSVRAYDRRLGRGAPRRGRLRRLPGVRGRHARDARLQRLRPLRHAPSCTAGSARAGQARDPETNVNTRAPPARRPPTRPPLKESMRYGGRARGRLRAPARRPAEATTSRSSA